MRTREEAAARCTTVIKSRVRKEQARKARAEALDEVCCLALGKKKKAPRKLLTELYVDGHFTEDTEERQKELQRHGDDVFTDQEETEEVQGKSIFF